MRHLTLSIILIIFSVNFVFSQKVVKNFDPSHIDSAEFNNLMQEYGQNKELPEGYEKQALIALSYFPELKHVNIVFKFKKKTSPLMAKPAFLDVIIKSPHNRTYYIIISSETSKYLKHIQFDTLSFNAQIGVLGHELSHVSDFSQRGFWGILQIAFGNLSSKWLDKFEYNTDRKTIDHGLGWQLLNWSCAVRQRLNTEYYQGANKYTAEQLDKIETENGERYMNPSTIQEIIENHPLYNGIYEQPDQ